MPHRTTDFRFVHKKNHFTWIAVQYCKVFSVQYNEIQPFTIP